MDPQLKALNPDPDIRNRQSYTIRPHDGRLLRVLGQHSELSYYDSMGINRAYCSDVCPSALLCPSGSYPGIVNFNCWEIGLLVQWCWKLNLLELLCSEYTRIKSNIYVKIIGQTDILIFWVHLQIIRIDMYAMLSWNWIDIVTCIQNPYSINPCSWIQINLLYFGGP